MNNKQNRITEAFSTLTPQTIKSSPTRNELMEKIRESVKSITDSRFELSDKVNLINDIEANIRSLIETKTPYSDNTQPSYKLILGTKGSGAPERAQENYLETPDELKEKYAFINKGTFGFIAQMQTVRAVLQRENYESKTERQLSKRMLLNKLMGIDELIGDVIAYDAFEKGLSIVRASNASPEDILDKVKKAQSKNYDTTVCIYHSPLKECAVNYNKWSEKNIGLFFQDNDFVESYVKTLKTLPLLLNHFKSSAFNFALVYNSEEQDAEHAPIVIIREHKVQNFLTSILRHTRAENGMEWDKNVLNKHGLNIDDFDILSQNYMLAFEELTCQEHETDFDPDLFNKSQEQTLKEKQKIQNDLNKKHIKTGHHNRIINTTDSDDTSSSGDIGDQGTNESGIQPIEP